MKYKNIEHARFIDRPNRFVAHVEIKEGGISRTETVHVKNTGRCRELLLPGVPVILEKSDNLARKTKYDLIMVWKESLGWVNIDSQACNKLAREWLETQNYDYIRPEYTYGNSRVDFYMEKAGEKYLLEVKGCTLEIDGIGYFPDAPTERGVKHLHELMKARQEGYHVAIAFVIQMNGIMEVRPNRRTHPEFGIALDQAQAAGVEVIYIPCQICEDEVIVL